VGKVPNWKRKEKKTLQNTSSNENRGKEEIRKVTDPTTPKGDRPKPH